MRYRWVEDSIQSVESYGVVLFLHQGKEFEAPEGSEEWIARCLRLGKIEKIEEVDDAA